MRKIKMLVFSINYEELSKKLNQCVIFCDYIDFVLYSEVFLVVVMV